jgi:hypothetical protein
MPLTQREKLEQFKRKKAAARLLAKRKPLRTTTNLPKKRAIANGPKKVKSIDTKCQKQTVQSQPSSRTNNKQSQQTFSSTKNSFSASESNPCVATTLSNCFSNDTTSTTRSENTTIATTTTSSASATTTTTTATNTDITTSVNHFHQVSTASAVLSTMESIVLRVENHLIEEALRLDVSAAKEQVTTLTATVQQLKSELLEIQILSKDERQILESSMKEAGKKVLEMEKEIIVVRKQAEEKVKEMETSTAMQIAASTAHAAKVAASAKRDALEIQLLIDASMSKSHERLLSTEKTLEVTMKALELEQEKVSRLEKNELSSIEEREEIQQCNNQLFNAAEKLELKLVNVISKLKNAEEDVRVLRGTIAAQEGKRQEEQIKKDALEQELKEALNVAASATAAMTVANANAAKLAAAAAVVTCDIGVSTEVSSSDVDSAMCRALAMSDNYQEEAELLEIKLKQEKGSNERMKQEMKVLREELELEKSKSDKFQLHASRIEKWFVDNHAEEKKEWEKEKIRMNEERERASTEWCKKESILVNENQSLMVQLEKMCNYLEKSCKEKKELRCRKKESSDNNCGNDTDDLSKGTIRETLKSLELAQMQVEKERKRSDELLESNNSMKLTIEGLMAALKEYR